MNPHQFFETTFNSILTTPSLYEQTPHTTHVRRDFTLMMMKAGIPLKLKSCLKVNPIHQASLLRSEHVQESWEPSGGDKGLFKSKQWGAQEQQQH